MRNTLTKSRKRRSEFFVGLSLGGALFASACSSMPESKYHRIAFPKKNAYLDETPPFEADRLGTVRTKISFPTIDPDHETDEICESAFNQGAHDLLSKATKQYGATAVVEVRSVVFYLDGKRKLYPQAECADDGDEGQILMQATAVRPVKKKKGRADRETRDEPFVKGER